MTRFAACFGDPGLPPAQRTAQAGIPMRAVAADILVARSLGPRYLTRPKRRLSKCFGINIFHINPLDSINCVEFAKIALCFQYFAGNRGEGWGGPVEADTSNIGSAKGVVRTTGNRRTIMCARTCDYVKPNGHLCKSLAL